MIYTAIDKWSSPDSYLEHHGVKGMKWGVRKQPESLGSRYSRWGRKVSNRGYDKKIQKVEERRSRKMNEVDNSLVKNTKYGNWVKKTSNKNYDKQIDKIEARRAKRMGEFDNFDKARSKGLTKGQKIAIGVGVGAAVALGATAAVAIAGNPGFTTKMKTVYQLHPKNGSLLANSLKKIRPSMQTPVANIKAGPSIKRSTIRGQESGLIRKTSKQAISQMRASSLAQARHSTGQARVNAINRLHMTGYNQSYARQYTPRYVTNKGGQVTKRLVRYPGQKKPYVLDRTLGFR